MKKLFIINLLILMMFAPVFASAQKPLVPCGDQEYTVIVGDKKITEKLPPCTAIHVFELISRIVKFLIFTVALPLCALAITYGGIKIAMYSTSPGEKEKGKEIVVSAIIGLMISLASYLLVDFVLKTFTEKGVDELQQDLDGGGFTKQ